MKIGDKVIVTNPLYAQITNGAVGTIVAEYIPNSQWGMLHGISKWVVEFDNPELNHRFLEEDLTLAESEVHANDGTKNA